MMKESFLKNQEGVLSGGKVFLVLAVFLAASWIVRDLATGRDLTGDHAAVLAALLVIGLVNRLSSRGHFKLELGRDGAKIESHPGNNNAE